ncbi:MAG TPA: (5-formylfuran-3-yl)methyl phosphate synthase, partial [Pirellulales bacterium]|nr:(5-formylfuran-3-yl)methyl phosphate synthase [Pirellulales bacterium]
MMRLLVSVRNAAEAATAVEAGIDLLDIKEPARGALGRADGNTIAEILGAVGGRVPVSAAAGELRDFLPDPAESRAELLGAPPPAFAAELQFAKFGLSGLASRPDWPARWKAALRIWPPSIGRVAVVYADWRTCAAPAPLDILAVGAELRCAAVLFDTFDKTRGNLLAHLPLAELAELIERARARPCLVALGGSLDRAAIARVAPLAPDVIAVRTAVCVGG